MTDMKVFNPDLSQTEMEVEKFEINPSVAVELLQALVRLMAHDKEHNIFRFLRTDDIGSLRVTNAFSGRLNTYHQTITTSTSPVLAFAADNRRKLMVIQNVGSVSLRYRYDAILSSGNGLELMPGQSLVDDSYTGDVTFWSNGATTTLNVMILSS